MNENHPYSNWKSQLARLSDDSVLSETKRHLSCEREEKAWVVAHFAEIFRRDLALKRGNSSIYAYARAELGLSEKQAWQRGAAARLALEVPATIARLASGELTLEVACAVWKTLQDEKAAAKQQTRTSANRGRLAPAQTDFVLSSAASEAASSTPAMNQAGPSEKNATCDSARPTSAQAPEPTQFLTPADTQTLFTRVVGKSGKDAQAALQNWKDERAPGTVSPPNRPKSSRRSLRGWTELSFQLNDTELAEFDRLRDLLSHKLRSRDPQAVFSWMLAHALDRVDPVRKQDRADRRNTKRAKSAGRVEPVQSAQAPGMAKMPTSTPIGPAAHPLPTHRFCDVAETPQREPIPAALRRKVWIRDEGECQFVDSESGKKCGSTAYADIDHRLEVCQGGENTEENLIVACSSHNRRRFQWPATDQPLYARSREPTPEPRQKPGCPSTTLSKV